MYKLICGTEVTAYVNGEVINGVDSEAKNLGELCKCETFEEARNRAYEAICAMYYCTLQEGLYEYQPPKTYDNGAYCINMIKKVVLGTVVEYRIVTEITIVKE